MENNLASNSSPPLATVSQRKFPVAATIVAAICILPVIFIAAVIGFFMVRAYSGGTIDPRHISVVQGLSVQLFAYVLLVPYLLIVMTRVWRVSLGDLGFRVPTWQNLGFALLGALGMIVLVQSAAAIITTALHSHHEEQAVQLLKAVKTPGVLAFFTIYATIIAPFVEELTFRVFFFNAALRLAPFWAAALFSGLLFGAAHADAIAFLPLAIGGMLLCYLYYKTRNAWVSMIAHGIFNGTTILALITAQHYGIK
ncbi:MAG: CPBP family intramembrane metalloprotease [Candidatus Eremiobacteraeota bacterium]|nr:CPBP family intramembrane metalloprotease [Candidatus Eremiobacteraeota bacterium]